MWAITLAAPPSPFLPLGFTMSFTWITDNDVVFLCLSVQGVHVCEGTCQIS